VNPTGLSYLPCRLVGMQGEADEATEPNPQPAAGGVDPLGPVFISYRQSDGTDTAVALAWALRAAGLPVWHDQTDLPPGDTATRLKEALASGLSGAILVVTPEIASSSVVRNIELPALLELAEDPRFTFSIVSTVHKAHGTHLDYEAPDELLGTAPGTLTAIDQQPVAIAIERAGVARAQARRRMEHVHPLVEEAGGVVTLDLQTRVPPFASHDDGHLVVRLRPPLDGQRRPHAGGLRDVQGFLGQLPQLLAIAAGSHLCVRGGAHLSVACAFGAAVPTTLFGTVEVLDTAGASWRLSGQADPGPTQLIVPVGPAVEHATLGPVLVYVDLLPERSDAAFEAIDTEAFAAILHLRPIGGGLLDPGDASNLVGQVTSALRALAGDHGTTEVHLLLRCPYGLALLIGRALNTLTVHLYEWEDSTEGTSAGPRYVPSLILRSGAGGSPIHDVTAPPIAAEPEET
jgi:hypothetical protein